MSENIIAWGKAFFPHHLTVPSPRLHYVMADMFFGPDPQVAVAAPRGHAKSTIADLVCLLYGAAKKKFRYALLVSDSSEQAELFLSEIRQECETNTDLITVYPGLAPGKPWKDNVLCLKNRIRIEALGQGKKFRGRKSKGSRPDFVLVDDLENDELCSSYERRLKLRRWFRATLLPAMAPDGRIRVVGTILHSDSLLSRLVRNSEWTRRIWRSLSDEGVALWPERHPAAKLLKTKAEAQADGLLSAWYQEYQNQAIADEEASFKSTDILYFSSIPLDQWGRPQKVYKTLYVDPAISQDRRADFSAYVVVYYTFDGYWWVREAFRARHNPDQIHKTIIGLQQKHNFDKIGVEVNQFQKSIVFWLEEYEKSTGFRLPIEGVNSDTDKRQRILALQPYCRSHRIRFWEGLDGRLEAELLNLDSIDHDDLADALAGSLFINHRPVAPKAPMPQFPDAASERAWKHRKRLKKRGKDS